MKALFSNDIKQQIEEIKTALKKTKNVRMYKRYSAILRHFEGFNNKEIAKMEGLEPHAVGNYIRNYKLNGLTGLKMKHIPGAERKFSNEQENKIFEIVTKNTPDEVGFEGRKNWTIEIIRQWASKEFNITMSHKGMALILHRLNLSYTRPTYVLAKADKMKQEKFRSDFETLKKTP